MFECMLIICQLHAVALAGRAPPGVDVDIDQAVAAQKDVAFEPSSGDLFICLFPLSYLIVRLHMLCMI